MIKDITRREFLNTVAGAAVSSAIIGDATFLDAVVTDPPSTAVGVSNSKCVGLCAPLESLIFPQPREISSSDSDFIVDNKVRIVVPLNASKEDLFLASLLARELSDRFGLHLKIERITRVSDDARVILMGSISNPLVRQCCARIGLNGSSQIPSPEGYVLRADSNIVLAAGSDNRGAFYGLQSLRQLVFKEDNQIRIRGVRIRDWPHKPFRGIYLYLPGRDNIPFFKRFVRDYMALYKYNTLIMEMGASMRLDSHPELNSGWVEFVRDCNYSCRNYPPGAFHDIEQNSSHQDTADGDILEKEEVADLARCIAQNQIELVPALASFTHSYYLLTKHKDLAAVPQNKWPDIYCASNPNIYPLLFEVNDEYIDLLKPKMVHIGHDELFLPVGVSPQCKYEDIGELFGEDVRKIHGYLSSRGIKTALWGDMLLQSVRGHGLKKRIAPDGWTYYLPGGLTPEQVERLIPKDCLIFNWFWHGGRRSNPELNEATLDKMGFQQIYGNFDATITNYEIRKKRSTLIGGAPSAWSSTNEIGFGKELMAAFLGCSSILWTGQVLQGKDLSGTVQSMLPNIRKRLSGIVPPSQTETSIVPVDISSKFNIGDSVPALGINLNGMTTGSIQLNNIPFDLKRVNGMHSILAATEGKQVTGLPKVVAGIPIGISPTSLIFLHASAKWASNKEGYRLIWDEADTADLLGWYEIVYEDGFVTTIPIRYGVNILEWNWDQRTSENAYCYGADAVAVGGEANNRITFFSFEWVNPRLGKVIREVRLQGTTGFRAVSLEVDNAWGPVIESNGVIVKAISAVKKRS
ncbi:MAG TPA: beta-N-acetylhexosaminidase [Acidobacteriaceae bacterium]|nr:beta-N-acetylhexosaminidase [Acidobacteriaceae bacterium]